ncbi:MAG: hypothetical protein Cons2KO_26860 [Congregibacter sp.]
MALSGIQNAYRLRSSAAILVIGNLIPLLGVLFFDWDIAALIILYWSENLIVGAYNIIKMLTVGGWIGIFPSLFFLIHYGGFCAVHGFFLINLLLDASAGVNTETSWPMFLVFVELLVDVVAQILALAPDTWIIAFIGLSISHGYSFITNFLRGGERQSSTVNSLMSAPYKRIVALHIAIIAGGLGVAALGEPMLLLLVFVAVKILVDLTLHRREHRKIPPAPTPPELGESAAQ